MSYSFSVTASTKAEANQKIAETFDATVVATQPYHEADRNAAVTVAQSFVEILADPTESDEICVRISGSLGWMGDVPEFIGALVSVSASLRKKQN